MKRIHLILLAIIFISIGAKVHVTPVAVEYPVLSGKAEKVDNFFEYRVNDIQTPGPKYYRCPIKPPSCCRV